MFHHVYIICQMASFPRCLWKTGAETGHVSTSPLMLRQHINAKMSQHKTVEDERKDEHEDTCKLNVSV